MSSSTTSNFELASNDAAFGARKKDIFATLDTIEAKHKAFETTKPADSSVLLKPDPTEEDLFTLSKIMPPLATFKVPVSGLPRKRKTRPMKHSDAPCRESTRKKWKRHDVAENSAAAFDANPKRWKRYDLSDISQHSEQQNSAAAFDFLNNLKPSGTTPGNSGASGSDGNAAGHKHIFKKPTKELTNIKNFSSGNSKPSAPSHLFDQKHKRDDDDEDDCNDPNMFLKIVPSRSSVPDVVPRNSDGEAMDFDSNAVSFRGANPRSKDRRVRNKDDSDSDDTENVSKPNFESVAEATSDDDSDEFGEYFDPSDDDNDEEMADSISDKEEIRVTPCVLRSRDGNDELDIDQVD